MNGRISLGIALLCLNAHSGEYLVKWKSAKAFHTQRSQFFVEKLSDESLLTKIDIPDEKKDFVLQNIKSDPHVEYVVANKTLKAFGLGKAEPKLQTQWALDKVNASAAWALAKSQGSQNVILAIIDTGVDYKHESLAANMISGYDFKDNDNDPSDVTSIMNPGHGTHCAGIAGATGSIENGTSGISPRLSIMPVRFLDKNGSGSTDDAVQSIDYAVEHGANVISASWGGDMTPTEAQPLIEAVKRASDAGVIFVTSSGNGDEDGVGYNMDYLNLYPASISYENTITVGATDQNDVATKFSNFGRRSVHIAAPGLAILSTLPGNRYDTLSGTSMSAPLVAGLVALLKSLNSSLSGADIKAVLQATGVPADIKTACNCRIDAAASVDAVIHNKTFIVPNAATLTVDTQLSFNSRNANGAVTYVTTDNSVASIDGDGLLSTHSAGDIKIIAKDESGNSFSTGWVRVKVAGDNSNDDNDGSSSSSSSSDPWGCPYSSPEQCKQECISEPHAPWCPIGDGA